VDGKSLGISKTTHVKTEARCWKKHDIPPISGSPLKVSKDAQPHRLKKRDSDWNDFTERRDNFL